MTRVSTRLRYLANLNPSVPEAVRVAHDREYSFLPMEAVGEDWSLDLSRVRPVAEVLGGYSYFADGDIAFAKVTPCFENGKAAIMQGLTHGVGFGTTELTIVRPIHTVNTKFLFYVLNEHRFKQRGIAEMTGAGGLKRVPDRVIRDFAIDLPSRPEQDAIASFLDRETAEIDAFIADQEELIGLLAERRAATISHAVTGAAGAQQVQVRRLVNSIEQGWSPVCENFAARSDEWGVLKVGCVNGGRFNPHENKALPPDVEPAARLSVSGGDVLVSRGNTRELVGSAAYVTSDHPNLILSDLLYRVRANPARARGDYLAMALGSQPVRGQIESSAKGTSASMQKLSQRDVLDLQVELPSLDSQGDLVASVSRETAELDAAIADAREAITLSRERRAALISAAVTGTIDMRGTA